MVSGGHEGGEHRHSKILPVSTDAKLNAKSVKYPFNFVNLFKDNSIIFSYWLLASSLDWQREFYICGPFFVFRVSEKSLN